MSVNIISGLCPCPCLPAVRCRGTRTWLQKGSARVTRSATHSCRKTNCNKQKHTLIQEKKLAEKIISEKKNEWGLRTACRYVLKFDREKTGKWSNDLTTSGSNVCEWTNNRHIDRFDGRERIVLEYCNHRAEALIPLYNYYL